MRKIAVTICLVLTSTPGHAQTSLVLFSGLNFPAFPLRLKESTFYLAQFWKNGMNLGGAFELELSKAVRLTSTIEYSRYPFDFFEAESSDGGFVLAAKAEPSRVYRFLIAVKYFTPTPDGSKSRPFLLSGVGYMVEKIGRIEAVWVEPGHPLASRRFTFPGKRFLVHTVGFGLRWRLSDEFGLDLEGKFFTDYKSRLQNSWNVGLVFVL